MLLCPMSDEAATLNEIELALFGNLNRTLSINEMPHRRRFVSASFKIFYAIAELQPPKTSPTTVPTTSISTLARLN